MKKCLSILAFLLSASLLGTLLATAQLPKPEEIVQVRVQPARASVKRGAATSFTLEATIKAGFHVNSNKPTLEYLIPSRVELLDSPPFVLEKAEFPPGELKAFGFAPDEKLSVYEGTVKVPVRVRAKLEAPAGPHNLRLAFHYQACNDMLCLRPAQREIQLKVRVE